MYVCEKEREREREREKWRRRGKNKERVGGTIDDEQILVRVEI